jgi:hypothetical protein
MEGRTPPVSLILSGVRFTSDPHKNLLREPVIVASVLVAPTVSPNENFIYATTTKELRINGTGFQGAKSVDLYFNPPLVKNVGYEIVSSFPLREDQLVLRLEDGYRWREEPGPLLMVGVDTGGGPIKCAGEGGARVAVVLADL